MTWPPAIWHRSSDWTKCMHKLLSHLREKINLITRYSATPTASCCSLGLFEIIIIIWRVHLKSRLMGGLQDSKRAVLKPLGGDWKILCSGHGFEAASFMTRRQDANHSVTVYPSPALSRDTLWKLCLRNTSQWRITACTCRKTQLLWVGRGTTVRRFDPDLHITTKN